MDGLHGLSKGSVDALKGLFVGLALLAVVLRLVANWKYNRKLLVDDCEFLAKKSHVSWVKTFWKLIFFSPPRRQISRYPPFLS